MSRWLAIAALAAAAIASGPRAVAQVDAFDAAALAARNGESEAAAKAVQCFLCIEPSADRDRRQAEAAVLAFEAGEFQRCLEWAAVADELGCSTSASRTAGWRSLVALGRTRELIADLRRSVGSAAEGDLVDLLTKEEVRLPTLADACMRSGAIDDGLWLFASIAERLPKDSVRLSNLGLALRHVGRLDEAQRCYEEALRIAPDDVFAWNDYGLLLRVRGDRRGAADAFARALALDGRLGEGPAITNVVLEAVLRGGSDPTEVARTALAHRPDAALLRRALIDLVLRSHRAPQLQQLPDNRAAGR